MTGWCRDPIGDCGAAAASRMSLPSAFLGALVYCYGASLPHPGYWGHSCCCEDSLTGAHRLLCTTWP